MGWIFEGYSDTRTMMNMWEITVSKEKIEEILNGNDFVLYFEKDNEIFGATEEGRLTFARMKNPDPDEKDMMKHASFSAINLSKAIEGRDVETVINDKDVKKLKIIDENKAKEELTKKASSEDSSKIKTKLNKKIHKDPNIPDNLTKVDEK